MKEPTRNLAVNVGASMTVALALLSLGMFLGEDRDKEVECQNLWRDYTNSINMPRTQQRRAFDAWVEPCLVYK